MSTLSHKEPLADGNERSLVPPVSDRHEGTRDNFDGLIVDLYSELHRMAAHALGSERSDHTLQPTALINELYLRLRGTDRPDWNGRTHFFAVAAKTMRRILIDHARAHRAERRGGDRVRVPLDVVEGGANCSIDDLLAIDEALAQLERADPRAASVTELWFFAGLEQKEIAEELSISVITAKRDWKFARAWLASYFKSRLRSRI